MHQEGVCEEKKKRREGKLRKDPMCPIERRKERASGDSQSSRHNQRIEDTRTVSIVSITCEHGCTCSIVPSKPSP